MIGCDLKDCVLNKRGECMKTNKSNCPYYMKVLIYKTWEEHSPKPLMDWLIEMDIKEKEKWDRTLLIFREFGLTN